MGAAITAFAAVFLAELPDKTMLATLLLTARHRRPGAVWAGVTTAFALHVTVAVLAGSLLSRLPERWLAGGVGCLFVFGGISLWRAGNDDTPDDFDAARVGWWRVSASAFATVLVAELGDLTQLATAGLAARSTSPWATGLGSLAALASVAALAAGAGEAIARRAPLVLIRRVGGSLFLALGLVAWWKALSIR